jgi:alanyl-tRNA synthetase
MLTGSEIRRKFLDFFIQKGHREVHSSSLVPANDPTLLFTNAGMNQFKDVFLGLEKRDYNRATTSQKCVRAGGKHNDLENVGFTNRHHTFFEMLGNFSFGDYFKKDAIAYAWELFTSPEWFNLPKEKLYATIFKGENGVPRDGEAYDLWLSQGVPKERVYEFGSKDNFWQMGDTGPCGPCSEIHYDMGVEASDQGHGTTAPACTFGCDCGRYVELWNLVFMQFDRDATGTLSLLPKPSIDTGMGLERIAAVLQGVISNYDTDLFTPLIARASDLVGMNRADYLAELGKEFHEKGGAASLRVIADHSRAATFLISDGVIPSNEGRSYVLRKIIRRAITHGRLLGQTKPFLHDMVFAVVDLMQDAYPELKESANRVSKVILTEEERFGHTLRVGLDGLREALRGQNLIPASEFRELSRRNPGATEAQWQKLTRGRLRHFDGHVAFYFTSTFGMPRDFIEDFCRDNDVEFDSLGYEEALAEEQTRARASWKGAVKQTANPVYQELPKSEFEGYRRTCSDNCTVLAIIKAGQGVHELKAGEKGEIILDHTPFYAESGGQVGDRGWLVQTGRHLPNVYPEIRVPYFGFQDSPYVLAEVTGTYAPIQGVRAHQVVAKQPIRVGDKLDAVVNADLRAATMRNHTATHLLQAGLREVLGKHVKQAGSLVAPNHLRFDFSHFTGVAEEELQDIEDIINKEVLTNEKIEVIEDVPIDVAINDYHAMALFGEKYGDRVRVIKIGDFSTELCGGTHTAQTGEIGLIKILKEGSVSSGVRRIEAVTGEGSLRHFRKDHQLEGVVASLTSKEAESPAEALRTEIDRRDAEIKRLTRELDQVRMKSASSSAANLGDKIKEVRGVKVLAHRADNLERSQMRTLVDQLRDKLGSGVVVVGSATNGNVSLIAGVTKDLTSRVQAGKIVGKVAEKVGGKGGGRPDLAEAGGKDAGALDSALADVYTVVEALLG